MKKLIIICLFLMFPEICSAATIYLDIAATGCTGGGAANTNYDPATRSCGSGASKVYAGNFPYEAATSLGNGDTLFIREGEYWEDVTSKPGYMWTFASLQITASNVTIKNHNSETVWIKGGPSRTTPANHPNNAIALSGSNNVIDGVYVYGGFIFSGTNNTLQNCDLSGGFDHQAPWNISTSDAAWPNVIRFISPLNALVRNCRMHDNVMPPAGGVSCNMSLIMHEHDSNTIIENSAFYNAVSGHWCTKYQDPNLRNSIQATYRYNIFDGPNGGSEESAQFYGQYNYFYQNIFRNSKYCFSGRSQPMQRFVKIYNNVFYNSSPAIHGWTSGAAGNYEFFNNIVYADSGTQPVIDFSQSSGSVSSGYYDYNGYYVTGSGSMQWGFAGVWYSSLSSWSSAIGSGDGTEDKSLTSNPGFTNSSGSFSQPSDFKRTSYPLNGRGGTWPTVMGAYITGSETIGPSSTLPLANRVPPSPPVKLR